jgi:hypothetical protein
MRKDTAMAGAGRHSMKKVLIVASLILLGLMPNYGQAQDGLTLGNLQPGKCLADRPLTYEANLRVFRMREDYEILDRLRPSLQTDDEYKYIQAAENLRKKYSKLFTDAATSEHAFHLLAEEELWILAQRLLGPNHHSVQRVRLAIRAFYTGKPEVRTFILRMVRLRQDMEEVIETTRMQPERKIRLQTEMMGSYQTVVEFWQRYARKLRAGIDDAHDTLSLWSLGALGAGVTVATTIKAVTALRMSLSAIRSLAPAVAVRTSPYTTLFSCLNGMVGSLSYTAAMQAMETTLLAWDRASHNKTPLTCEVARLTRAQAAAAREAYLWSGVGGFVLGCAAGAAANRWPDKTAKAVGASVGVSMTYNIGDILYSELVTRRQLLAMAESAKYFADAQDAIEGKNNEQALAYLFQAEEIARRNKIKSIEVIYQFVTLKSIYGDIGEVTKSAGKVIGRSIRRAIQRYPDFKKHEATFLNRYARRNFREDLVGIVASSSDIVPIALLSILRLYSLSTDEIDGLPRIPVEYIEHDTDDLIRRVYYTLSGQEVPDTP